MPISRVCKYCSKEVKSTGGLERHRIFCESKHFKRPRLYLRPEALLDDAQASSSIGWQTLRDGKGTLRGTPSAHGPAVEDPSEDTLFDEEGARGIDGEDEELARGTPAVRGEDISRGGLTASQGGMAGDVLIEETDAVGSSTISGVLNRTGRNKPSLCSSATYREEAFPNAGTGKVKGHRASKEMEIDYYPFQSATDYAWAKWAYNTRLTKGSVDTFFQDPNNKISRFSFSNGRQWLQLLDKIPYGIQDDKWQTKSLRIPSGHSHIEDRVVEYVHRDVLTVIRFLLGHRPFKDDLVYAPVRQFNGENQRIYTEMHTGDWWWRVQNQLPSKATLVPLLLASDKTMLTKHRGDLAAWPVYVTIGNLKAEARRSQKRPGLVLLGLLPVFEVDEKASGIKARMWHHCLGQILEPLVRATEDGVNIVCADGLQRRCYPVIAAFMADYEEQVLITGVKSNQECPICKVPPNEREDLEKTWEKRTHEHAQAQTGPCEGASDDEEMTQLLNENDGEGWVASTENFAWRHGFVNIHGTIMLDGLHQLLKGTVDHLMTWLEKLIHSEYKGRASTATEIKKRLGGHVLLDERFRAVPHFTDLKRFPKYSKVKQWTAADRRAIIRQLLPVIAPLLTAKKPHAVHCARAMVDFVLLAQYRSHDEDTLEYLGQALERLNKLKWEFEEWRPSDQGIHHFNFPKWHMLSHYIEFIKNFGTIDNFSTEHSEAAHKYLIKDFFDRTNKRNDWHHQLVDHNVRHLKLLAMDNHLLYQATRASRLRQEDTVATVTTPTRPKRFEAWVVGTTGLKRQQIRNHGYNRKIWTMASGLELISGYEGVLDALAVFVRTCRRRRRGEEVSDQELYKKEADSRWAGELYVCFHPALKCWKTDGKNPSDLGTLTSELVRCCPNWHGRRQWRCDHVLVQNRDVEPLSTGGTLDGRVPGRLLLILTVADTSLPRVEQQFPHYSCAWIELLDVRNGGVPHAAHGMIEVQTKREDGARTLRARRFFELSTILRSVHIVPGSKDQNGKQGPAYINNFVDFDSYNSIYDRDFMKKGRDVAKRYTEARNRRR